MRLHRFFIKEDANGKIIRITDSGLIKQWRDVLRLKGGAEIFVFNGNGMEARAKIVNLSKDGAELEVVDVFKNENEPERKVILYCSLLKHENFELVVKKATEVGMCEIVPIVARRTEKLNLRGDRLEKIIKEAAEQSGRAIVPRLREPVKFEEALEHAKQNDVNLFFDKSGQELCEKCHCEAGGRGNLAGSTRENEITTLPLVARDDVAGVFIGPEGGWTDEELKLAKEAGFKIISLGKLTLRAETAAIVAVYLTTNH